MKRNILLTRSRAEAKGQTSLSLMIASVIVLLLLFIGFAFNYNMLMGTHKQALTGADAAAIAGAVDMSRIVVQSPMGPIGLVDDSPGTANTFPVRSLNTVMATVRLDSLISNYLGSQTMLYCANQDFSNASSAGQQLQQAIQKSAAGTTGPVDKNNNPVNINSDVTTAYLANRPKMPSINPASTPTINTPVVGYVVNSAATCSTPTPQPKTASPAGDPATASLGTGNYVPYQNYTAPGYGGASNKIQFFPIALTASLIANDSSAFMATAPANAASYLPPTAVQVTVIESVKPLPTAPQNQSQLTLLSTAEAGGANSNIQPSGTLMVSFASGGIPAYPSVSAVNFTTPQTIMNADPINPNQEANPVSGGNVPTLSQLQTEANTAAQNAWSQSSSAFQGAAWNDAVAWANYLGNPFGGHEYGGMGVANYTTQTANAQTGLAGYGYSTPPASTTSTNGPDISGTGGWSSDNGLYLIAENGSIPGGGGTLVPATVNPTNTSDGNSVHGTAVSSPSVALAFDVYDWVKSMGLRPTIASVVDAMELAPWTPGGNNTSGTTGFYQLETQAMGGTTSTPHPISFDGGRSFSAGNHESNYWMPPAYADRGSTANGITMGLNMNFSYKHPENDPRNLMRYPQSPATYNRHINNSFGYVPADVTIPDNNRVVKVSDGVATTTNGQPVVVLYNIWDQLQATAKLADITKTNAWAILSQSTNSILGKNENYTQLYSQSAAIEQSLKAAQASGNSQQVSDLKSQKSAINQQLTSMLNKAMGEAEKKHPRAAAALINAKACLAVCQSIINNMKTLTALGASQISTLHYVLGGDDFYPPSKAATIAQLHGTLPVSTGQDNAAPFRDWTQAPGPNNASQLVFLSQMTTKISQVHGSNEHELVQPAYAQASSAQNPYQNLKFAFYINGSAPGTGIVQMVIGQDPFANMGILQQQTVYQDTQALETSSSSESANNTTVNAVNPGPLGSSSVTTTTTTNTVATNTNSVWQVESRDEFANAAGTSSYFANMTASDGANTVAPAAWCDNGNGGSNNLLSSWQTPQCPSLASEWELTCPQVVTTNNGNQWMQQSVVYNPNTIVNTSTGEWGYCVGAGGLYFFGVQTQVINVAQSFTVNGVTYTIGTMGPGAVSAGNGWFVTTGPVTEQVYYAYSGAWVDATQS